jgi:CCR4-NOT transcription complex subunit 2
LRRAGLNSEALGLHQGQDVSTREGLALVNLPLQSSAPVYPNFALPWANDPSPAEPLYINNKDYRVQMRVTQQDKLGAFDDKTLLYMFYAHPKDVLQILAARELHFRRGWRYHSQHKVWFRGQSVSEDGQQWQYFDHNQWLERVHALRDTPASLTAGFLSDADIQAVQAAAQQVGH